MDGNDAKNPGQAALLAGDLGEGFRAFLLSEHGLVTTGEIKEDGQFHGLRTGEDKAGSAPLRYCVHLDEPPNVFYLDNKRGIRGTWFPEGREPLDPAEREQQRREFEKRRAEREQEAATRHASAAARARKLWAKAEPASRNHPYLIRKAVEPHGLRILPAWTRRVYGDAGGSYEAVTVRGVLLVPMLDGDGTLWNVQAIFPEVCPELGRDKDFMWGGRKQGLFHCIGEPTETLCIAEGYATAASIHEATGHRVYVAFDAGNLAQVALAVRQAWPDARIVICADNDRPDKAGRRAGPDKAREAAAAVGGFVAMPPAEGQDFNDWAAALAAEGEEPGAVKAAIDGAAMPGGKPEGEFMDDFQGEWEDVKKSSTKNENRPSLPSLPSLAGLPEHFSRHSAVTDSRQSVTDPSPVAINPALDGEKPTLDRPPGLLIVLGANGEPKRLIESKAARLLAGWMRQERYAYDPVGMCWHRFDGECWAVLPSPAEPYEFIHSMMEKETEPLGYRSAYFNGAVRIMQERRMLPLPPEPKGCIPFKNGLLDLQTKMLEPIRPDNAATWVIPYEFRVDSACGLFFDWVNSVTGEDIELIRLLRAFMNAVLNGRADLQKFLHIIGPGGTGKSTFNRLLKAMLGDSNCVSTNLKELEQNRFETARLYGKRLAMITDSDKYGGSVNVLKAVTGQDPLRNEHKHVQAAGIFTFEGLVLILSNEPLASTDYTSGLDRRRLVVKFDERIPPAKKAAFLAGGGEEQLHREIPAIVNWALQLTPGEVTDIFMHPPASAAAAAFDALTAQNPIAEWITENLLPAPGHFCATGINEERKTQDGRAVFEGSDEKLYPNYLQWCVENRREARSLNRFRHAVADMIKTLGVDVVEINKNYARGIQGIRIRHPYEDVYPWQKGKVTDLPVTQIRISDGQNALEAQPVTEVTEVTAFCGILSSKKSASSFCPT